MALNSEHILSTVVPHSAEPEMTTARGQVLTSTPSKIATGPSTNKVLSEAKIRQLDNARESKKRKREEERLKQQALHEEIQKTRAELSSVKGMLETQVVGGEEKMDTSSSEESDSSSSSEESLEDEAPRLKRRRVNPDEIPRSTPHVSYDPVPTPTPRSIWGKIGGLLLIAAANAVVATMGVNYRPNVGNGQKQPPANPFSAFYG